MNKTASCELLLFVSGEAGLTLAELSALTEMSKQACQQQIDYLKEKYHSDEESALTIIETAGKYRMATKEEFAEILKTMPKLLLINPCQNQLLKFYQLLLISNL